ncbi:hypothetical protein FDECE_11708 [Fusarium decemcellulare]|nr:hypothetical protein FDECE_11708 [Fusarium decemcellulare]
MSTLQSQSKRLDALSKDIIIEKRQKFQGIVRVRIEDLIFAPDDSPCDCNIDEKKVARLKHVFVTEGCDRTNPQNFILGEIPRGVLQAAIQQSNLTPESLRDNEEPPMLYLPRGTSIRCAQGRSRAKAILDIQKLGCWWPIELYTELDPETFEAITESYEIMRYLELIFEIWVKLMESTEALQYVDPEAVPVIKSSEAFKRIKSPFEREKLLERIKAIKFLIPSIHTLQKDFKYLQPCTDTLQRLILGKEKIPSIVQEYTGKGRTRARRNRKEKRPTVQKLAYDAFRFRSHLGPDSLFLGKMKRLYLYIMRDMVELTGQSPLLEKGEEVHEDRYRHQRSWHQLARRAKELGFESAEIDRLISENPDHQIALKALRDARPPSEYEYDDSQVATFVNCVSRALEQVVERCPTTNDASFTAIGAGEPIERRCGRQYSKAYARDRWMFKLSEFSQPTSECADITSLFVRKSVFHAFWRLEDVEDDSMSGASPSGTPLRDGLEPHDPSQPAPGHDSLIQQELARQYSVEQYAMQRQEEWWQEPVDQVMVDRVSTSGVLQELARQQHVQPQGEQLEQSRKQDMVRQQFTGSQRPAMDEGSIISIQNGSGWDLVRPMARQAQILIRRWDQSKWLDTGYHDRHLVLGEIKKLEEQNGNLLILHPENGRVLCQDDIASLEEVL